MAKPQNISTGSIRVADGEIEVWMVASESGRAAIELHITRCCAGSPCTMRLTLGASEIEALRLAFGQAEAAKNRLVERGEIRGWTRAAQATGATAAVGRSVP